MTDEELINSILGEHEEQKKNEVSTEDVIGSPDDKIDDMPEDIPQDVTGVNEDP